MAAVVVVVVDCWCRRISARSPHAYGTQAVKENVFINFSTFPTTLLAALHIHLGFQILYGTLGWQGQQP